MKTYDIIYADPPWRYEWAHSKSRAIENHYPTMLVDEIKLIQVPSKENSVCFLWTTAPKLLEGLDVLKAWGFNYRTHLIWDKKYFGQGYWSRGVHEILLIGIKGSFPCPTNKMKKIPSIIREKRRKHSQKPEIIRKLITIWYPAPKYTKIELFARDKYSGWDVWGNEIDNTRSLIQLDLDSA